MISIPPDKSGGNSNLEAIQIWSTIIQLTLALAYGHQINLSKRL